ncbi:methionine aminotransferase [Aegicerativicinus sediminis]|uniref:methionine aminotransferase n=1 Tax=Aegicerativicinus sediminis TaxID=2893202 RepID=UPI001E579686|nr:methionine aminotransferase [Aegicerativicinus sediminis]
MKFQSKLPNVGTTIFTLMSALAKQNNAINLSQGFPDFESDPILIKEVNDAMENGFNQYAPMAGDFGLRVEISRKFNTLYNSTYNPDTEITVTAGATQGIFTVISAFIKPSDEVIIFTPAYDSYQPSIEVNGGKTVPIQMQHNGTIDWDEVENSITDKTRMMLINTPHNPTGTILKKQDLLNLEQLALKHDFLVLSDEVYEHIIFDQSEHQSVCRFPQLKERSFIVASFGKTFHNTGWKVGYCCAPKHLMSEFRKVHQFNVFSVNHPMQVGLANYMQNPYTYLNISKFYQRKRDLFLELMKDSNFVFKPSEGTYFQVVDYSKITGKPDVEFAKELTTKYGVAAIPLSVFNKNKEDLKQLRFCFAKKEETLIKATEILNRI